MFVCKSGAMLSMSCMWQACSVRGWTIPSLSDVEAKSQSLAAAGFTTVDGPSRSASPSAATAEARDCSLHHCTICSCAVLWMVDCKRQSSGIELWDYAFSMLASQLLSKI